jgi:polysaccharide pyruvyl transferase WcaK-like protein
MRILVENSEYWLSNIGDLAMMDVTVHRLRDRWPTARIGVLTDTPHLLTAYFPDVEPVDPRASTAWDRPGLLVKLAGRAGPRVVGPVSITYVTARAWLPQKVAGARRKARRLRNRLLSDLRLASDGESRKDPEPNRFRRASATTLRAASSSSLVLAMGGGYITDQDLAQSTRVFSLLEHSSRAGVPTAMVGQGLGPIEDPELFARAAEVLPSVDFIALRERRRGPDLLDRAGVKSSRVKVTGDDAIELAHSVRRPDLGRDLGVCLRVAGYSPVTRSARAAVAAALRAAAAELDAGLVPVVIAEYRNQDRRSTLALLDGLARAGRPLARFARPQDVARQVGTCRVLVTGAYHAAVFALSQGIPVVALTSSLYYDDKFLGLGEMFGEGLQLIRLDEQALEEHVLHAVRAAWASAADVRPRLLARAEDQIAASREGFERVFDLAARSSGDVVPLDAQRSEVPT